MKQRTVRPECFFLSHFYRKGFQITSGPR